MNTKNIWKILNNLDVVTIVAASPRPGSDFVHSLLDNHDQIMTFDGWLLFHEFYRESISIYGTKKFLTGINNTIESEPLTNINISNFFYEFAWNYLHKFDSRYDTLEGKGNLGSNGGEYNLTNIDKFVEVASQLISEVDFSRRNALLVIYASYEIVNGSDLRKKKILLHCVHLPEYIPILLNDFSSIKVIACVRDPRVYSSKILNYYKNISNVNTCIGVNNAYLKLALDGVDSFKNMQNIETRVVVLEGLHRKPQVVMESICNWLGLEYENTVLESTWRGKYWFGDTLSSGIDKFFDMERYTNDKNLWLKDLTVIDQIVIESMMKQEMKIYGYKTRFKSTLWYFLSFILIILPTKYETLLFARIMSDKSLLTLIFFLRSILGRYLASYKKLFLCLFNSKSELIIFGKYDHS